ncbi:helix-turn-helix domain-containing protein [Arabiibacter massiliensis]|uniref:helix-turn-helix domain-containing protein n=1 Tax=Arabiibacter massiliensis TaxID=1870985 RepID=UPI001179C47D|nr:helix-turn-helix transcriptional regulator [Arabiibacter massiliensis]
MGNGTAGKKKTGAAQRGEALLVAAYCLSCCEIFFLYRNFRIPADYLESITIPLFGSFVAVISALALCLALLAAYIVFKKRIGSDRHLVAACICSSVAPMFQLVVGHALRQSWAIIPCIVLTAAGFICFLPEMVRRLASVGVSCSVRCNIAACIALLVVAPLSSLVPMEVFIVAMCLNPALTLYCLRASSAASTSVASVEVQEGQKIPKILLLTIIAACVMEGVVAAVDYSEMDDVSKIVVFSLAYIVAAGLIYVVVLRSRSNYNNAIFRVCFPVMAAGVSLFVFEGAFALNVGTFIFLVGRQLFAATILALVVYLIRYLGSDYYLLSVSAVVGAMLGSCVGLALYGFLGQTAPPAILPPTFLVYLLLGVLLVAIYLMSASNLKTRWGMVAIDDSEEKVGLTFEQSCLILAEKWGLTKRESEIVALMVKGRDKQAIAEKLYISEGTVKVHARNIYQKMGIHSKQELIDLVESTEESIKE